MKKILLVQLVSNGDCLMATTLARQIKHDNPGCHLTWAISYKCRQVIDNNPDVDEIWEIKYGPAESPLADVWYRVKQEAEARKAKGEFDKIIYSQICPDNTHNFDGTTRSSIFRAYPGPITVPVTPIIRLDENEVARVREFVNKCELRKYRHVLLCECAPSSGQSFLNPELMLKIAEKITAIREDTALVISTHLKLETANSRIIDASELTYRENAELSKYCTLLIGCSSGITWLLTSDWAKQIPTVQFLKNRIKPYEFASLKYDFRYWNLPTGHIIESTRKNIDQIYAVITASLSDFNKAKNTFDENLRPKLKTLRWHLRSKFTFRSFKTIKYFFSRNRITAWAYFLWPYMVAEALAFNPVYKLYSYLPENMFVKRIYRKIKNNKR